MNYLIQLDIMHDMLKALLFDFDGVLASSEEPRFKALKSFAGRYGVKIDDSVKQTSRGKTTSKVLHELFPDDSALADTILSIFRDEYRENITKHVVPIDFTVNFIREYHGALPLAIASMSSMQTIERLSRHFGIYDKITYIVSKDEVTRHKPDPEIYLKAALDLQVHPEECLVFEDSTVGFQAAINANMPCCIVLNGENNKEEFEGLSVHSFIENEEDIYKVVL